MNEEKTNQEKQDIKIGVKVNRSGKLIVALIISIFIIAALIYFIFGGFKIKEEKVVSSSTLEKIVRVRDLSAYKFIYNGIAAKYKGKKKVKYYVYYESTVKAKINLKNVKITKKGEKVIVKLPKISYDSYNVDLKSLEIMNMGVSLDESTILQEAYHAALDDLGTEVKFKHKKEIDKVAKKNAEAIVKGLIEPLVKSHDYKVIFK